MLPARSACGGRCLQFLLLASLAALASTLPAEHRLAAAAGSEVYDEALNCLQRQVASVERPAAQKAKKLAGTPSQRPPLLPGEDVMSGQELPSIIGGNVGMMSGSCGPPLNSSGFARLVNSNGDWLGIDLTDSFRKQNTVSIMVTAMSIAGSYTDEFGFDLTRGEPLEDTESTLLELRISPDGRSVDVFKPVTSIRTSDHQSRKAVRTGLGSGWLDSLEKLPCRFREDPRGDRVVVDAEQLLLGGFYVASVVSGAQSYRVIRAKDFSKNFDVSVEYLMGNGFASMRVGFSVVLLPEVPMAPRTADDRLLFFTTSYEDLGYREADAFTAPSHEVDRELSMIWRYNLEALEDKTIRIYVDPSVPSRWRPWFREGIEAWNDGFLQAGLPSAVRAVLPEDQDWPEDYDLADARFSTISWDLSGDDVMSMGVAKVDPRSGEIIKSDITMSDGWVRAWLQDLDDLVPELTHMSRPGDASTPRYSSLLQQEVSHRTFSKNRGGHRVETGRRTGSGNLRLSAKHMNATAQEALLGSGLKSIVMHETGHILGLRHNFKGSLGVSLACLKDTSCTGKQGIGSSVMDYVPMNMPESDKDDVHAFSPVIGGYDKLAIAYGYTKTKEDTWPRPAPELQKLLQGAESFKVCYDEDQIGEDPTCVAYDMSEDPIAYFELELERHVKAQQNLLQMAVAPGEPYRLYGKAFSAMLNRALSMSSKLIDWLGGIEDRYVHRSLDGGISNQPKSRQPVSLDGQRRALALLLRILRPSLSGLLPPEENLPFLVEGSTIGDSVSSVDSLSMVRTMTGDILSAMLTPARLLQIHRQEYLLSTTGTSEAFGVGEFLEELVGSILEQGLDESNADQNLTPQEMDLQMLLVSKLKDLYLQSAGVDKSESAHSKRGAERQEPTPVTPVLPAVVSSQLLYYLQRVRLIAKAAEERIPVQREALPSWHHCAIEGEACKCQGLVRFAMASPGTAQEMPSPVFSAAQAASNSTQCSNASFHVEEDGMKEGGKAGRWCECLAFEKLEKSELLSAHLSLMTRELSAVFCEADESSCFSPRVKAPQPSALLAETRSNANGVRFLAIAVLVTFMHCFA